MTDGWGLGANSAELTTAELVAGGVVHRPISAGGVFLGALEMQAKIVHPFVELVWGTEGEARDKPMFLVEEDLGGANDDALDRGVEDNLPGDGIEGHLVVGFVYGLNCQATVMLSLLSSLALIQGIMYGMS